jgi:hypothetical protein
MLKVERLDSQIFKKKNLGAMNLNEPKRDSLSGLWSPLP